MSGIVMLLLALAVAASAAGVDQIVERALAARAAGEYGVAIRLFREALAQAPARSDIELLLAETLAWDKQLDGSERLYRALSARQPRSHAVALGLARVLLWKGEYDASKRAFTALVAANPDDADALEGRATAEYWSGDFRSAARDFRRTLAIDPARAVSRRSLAEIEAATGPEESLASGYTDDDQPFTMWKSDATGTFWSDPMTRWSATAGAYRATSTVYGNASLPFLRAGNETTFPLLRLTASPWVGLLRYGDGIVRPVGGFDLSLRLFATGRLIVGADRQELLATATGLTTHPSVARFHAGWRRESKDGWLAAVEASTLRYFDANRGAAAYAYALAPFLERGGLRLYAGASAAYADTRDSRFEIAQVSSVHLPSNAFRYTYRGTYAPYWTPQNLREARAILVAQTTVRSAVIKLHVDGGVARDRAVAFGPSQGGSPIPAFTYPVEFDREFHPWRAELSAAIPIARGLRAEIGVDSTSTVFYRAKSIHATVVRYR